MHFHVNQTSQKFCNILFCASCRHVYHVTEAVPANEIRSSGWSAGTLYIASFRVWFGRHTNKTCYVI